MPRARTILLAAVTVVLTAGVGACVAWRWLLRDALARKDGRILTWSELSQSADLAGIALGILFLPVTWGGVLTFLSPMLGSFNVVFGTSDLASLPLYLAAAIGAVGAIMALLYATMIPATVGADVRCTPHRWGWLTPWAAHFGSAVAVGLPGVLAWLVMPVGGIVAVPLTLVAFAAPAVGATLAIPVLVRRFEMRLQPAPSLPIRKSPLFAVGAFAAHAVLWALVGSRLLAPPEHAPLLGHRDFDRQVCGPAPFELWGGEVDRALVRAGFVLPVQAPAGTRDVRGSSLAWASRWDEEGRRLTTFVRFPRDGDGKQPRRSLEVLTASTLAVAMRTGVAIIEEGDMGGRKVVLIDGDLARRAEWPLPSLSAAPHAFLAPDGDRGLMVGLVTQASLQLTLLRADLAPTGRTRTIPLEDLRWYRDIFLVGRGPNVSYSAGRFTCLRLNKFGSGYRLLVIDRGLQVWSPSAWHRAWAGAGMLVPVLLVLAVLELLLLLGVIRSGRPALMLHRERVGETLWAGHGTAAEGQLALLLTTGGDMFRVDLSQATLLGLYRGGAIDSPIVVIGQHASAERGTYRGNLPEITGARLVVRGNLAEARGAATDALVEAVRRAAALGWLIAGAPLLYVLLS